MLLLFDEVDVPYALTKIGEHLCAANREARLGPAGANVIITLLRRLESKMRQFNCDPDTTELPRALYTAEQLQSYVKGEPCAIVAAIDAGVFLRALSADLAALRQLEPDLPKDGIHLVSPKDPN